MVPIGRTALIHRVVAAQARAVGVSLLGLAGGDRCVRVGGAGSMAASQSASAAA